ncbi:MAG: oligosaccharide flippase family protein [Candidatus Eiseniibacteriota bacterium]
MRRGEIAHSVSRGAFYLAIEKVAALLSGTAYFALLLRWVGPTNYGTMILALSFAGLATIVTGNFETYLERFAAEYQARSALATLRRAHLLALALKLALGVVAALIMIFSAPFLARQFNAPWLAILIPLLSPMVAFDGLATTGRATLYGLQRFRAVCVLAVLFHVLKTVMVGMLWFAGQHLRSLAIGIAALAVVQGIMNTVVSLWSLRAARDETPAAERPSTGDLLHSILRYCLPMLGARGTYLAGQNLGKVVLGKLFDVASLGYYSFAFQTMDRLMDLIYPLPSALLPSLTHLVTRQERERLADIFDQAFRLIQVTACVLAAGVFVFAHELTLLVASPLFEPAVPLLRVMALIPIARSAHEPMSMLFQAMHRPGAVLSLALLKFTTEFSGYFVLVPMFGMMGAGWASLAGAFVAYLGGLLILSRLLPEGAAARSRTVSVALLFTGVLCLAGLALDRSAPFGWGFVARLALIPPALLALFALQLVTGYDLHKLSELPLRTPWLSRPRDFVVACGDRLARAVAPRKAA